MMAGGIKPGAPAPAPPQYAQFEVGPTGHAVAPKAISDDALPPMPSWETASKRRISIPEDEKGVELEDLKKGTGQKVPLMSGAGGMGMASPGLSPGGSMTPYSEHPVQPRDYMAAGGMAGGAMAGSSMNARSPNGPYNRGPGSAMSHRSPGTPVSPYNNNSTPARGPGQNPYDNYFEQKNGGMATPQPTYGRSGPGNRQLPNASPGPNGMGMRGPGGPGGFPPPQRQYSNDRGMVSAGPPPRSPYGGPPPQLARGPTEGIMEMPSPDEHRVASPLQNNAGFNFANAAAAAPVPYPASSSHRDEHSQYDRDDEYSGQNSYGGNTVAGVYAAPKQQQLRPQLQQQQQQSDTTMRGGEYASYRPVAAGGPLQSQQPQQHDRSIAHQREQSQAYEMDGGMHIQQGEGSSLQSQNDGGYVAYSGNSNGASRW